MKKNTLFGNEERVLEETIVTSQGQEIPHKIYKQLSKDYAKLLKQTKLLVKMSDKQQYQLSELAEKIKTKNQNLIQLDQEKNEFLGIVAHDLKNPLNAIQGSASFIKEALVELSQQEILELMDMIEQASRQMYYLVSNLLDVNAIESGKINLVITTIDLLPIIQALIIHYKPHTKAKQISLKLHSPESKHLVLADQNMLYQILDNLISNAIKYSPMNKKIDIHVTEELQMIRCEVKDEGPGLSELDQKKLFNKFTRLTAKPTADEHSTGLGLFIVKKLIEMMQGKVWCESKLENGCKFIVTFPTGDS
ncbi:HAMP domain-containing sensor histidine kinase [Candidatus Halobeggiatoa sp. HSG11]|nr:HAMP domain-containing sensor histidine kinase [Candidatus Halobeggiatoa sp. HSG11]